MTRLIEHEPVVISNNRLQHDGTCLSSLNRNSPIYCDVLVSTEANRRPSLYYQYILSPDYVAILQDDRSRPNRRRLASRSIGCKWKCGRQQKHCDDTECEAAVVVEPRAHGSIGSSHSLYCFPPVGRLEHRRK